jgi:superfamily I DNA/RNA helicase/mRNA-degrading endonuclease RelE of RelBE toxin-antitoxin system
MTQFRIADTFTDSLARLTGDEQKAVKTTAFDLQLNPANPGMQLHKLDRAKDRNFWSVRVSADLRIIVHKSSDGLLLCYVNHHDKAYRWAERRTLEVHPRTGAAQFVEIRETVQEIAAPRYVDAEAPIPPKPALFAGVAEDRLLEYGVPAEWLNDVLAADEDSLLDLVEHLPAEAAEALLELAVGGIPPVAAKAASAPDRLERPAAAPAISASVTPTDMAAPAPAPSPFEHPDAQRRFRSISTPEELERALEYPWEKWTVFLHPAQRELVEQDYGGPARISGSAGTGKTIVGLHRAVFLARKHPDARVLLATFSDALANALSARLWRLIGNEPRLGERLEVHAVDEIGRRLYELQFGPPRIADRDLICELLASAAADVEGHRFSPQFLLAEWEQVVDAWQLDTWEAYRDVPRLGRKTRLPGQQRAALWSIFERAREALKTRALTTMAGLFNALAAAIGERKHAPFDHVIVDEAQDVSVAQLKFLAALGGERPNGLFFTGDLGQRIFQQPFSWRTLGVEVRGRSHTLRVNYRTSHQIRMQADRLLGSELADVDGNVEARRGTISLFTGPVPVVEVFATAEEETEAVGRWLSDREKEGIQPREIAVFVRSEAQLDRARAAIDAAGIPYKILDEKVETTSEHVSISTMHLAKGLEFRAVAVIGCDDEMVPLQSRVEDVTDDSDLDEVYNTERQLLYVACTRARDHLLVTAVEPGSEFLDDLRADQPLIKM